MVWLEDPLTGDVPHRGVIEEEDEQLAQELAPQYSAQPDLHVSTKRVVQKHMHRWRSLRQTHRYLVAPSSVQWTSGEAVEDGTVVRCSGVAVWGALFWAATRPACAACAPGSGSTDIRL